MNTSEDKLWDALSPALGLAYRDGYKAGNDRKHGMAMSAGEILHDQKLLQALLKWRDDYVNGLIGEQEDLSAPHNRHTDWGTSSDGNVPAEHLYIIRRATRNVYRSELRAKHKENQS